MPNIVDIIIIIAVVVAVFFAIRKSIKSKGCVGCSGSDECSGSCCSSADKMVSDMEKAVSDKESK